MIIYDYLKIQRQNWKPTLIKILMSLEYHMVFNKV